MEISKLFMSTDVYEIRPRQDKRGFGLMFDALPFAGLWYTQPDHAIGYAREPELLNCFVFT
jgi:hypothetical protein